MAVFILDHPVLKHKMSLIRKKDTSTIDFRKIVQEISVLMAYEVTKNLRTEDKKIETPIAQTLQPFLSGKKLVLVPILRAGLGMVEGMLQVLPSARVGHIGLYRNEETLQPVEYFVKLPDSLENREVLLLDPMLATGHSACSAISILKKRNAKQIKLVCLLGSIPGVETVKTEYPDVDIYLVTVDKKLNKKGYITPGLGDAGDRLFGTK